MTPISCVHTVTVTLPRVEAKPNSYAVPTDTSSATAVGLFLSGMVAGALGVLLIVGIMGGACRLRRNKDSW